MALMQTWRLSMAGNARGPPEMGIPCFLLAYFLKVNGPQRIFCWGILHKRHCKLSKCEFALAATSSSSENLGTHTDWKYTWTWSSQGVADIKICDGDSTFPGIYKLSPKVHQGLLRPFKALVQAKLCPLTFADSARMSENSERSWPHARRSTFLCLQLIFSFLIRSGIFHLIFSARIVNKLVWPSTGLSATWPHCRSYFLSFIFFGFEFISTSMRMSVSV